MSERILHFEELSREYSALLCDVWGVLHNGQRVYADADAALCAYRKRGGKVILLTNSPRRHPGVRTQLAQIGVDEGAYDAIVTSGDATHALIQNAHQKIYHLGPQRDRPLFEGIDVEWCDEHDCQTVVCTGLFNDEEETPEDYQQQLQALAARHVPFICANPDLVVERGARLIYCAGALAALYEQLGGDVLLAGKPFQPIYDLAMQKLMHINGVDIGKEKVLAIGDGMPTDVKGAHDNGFDLLYISAGIHNSAYGGADNPDEKAVAAFLRENQVEPRGWMPRLEW